MLRNKVLTLACLLALGLTACGGDDQTADQSGGSGSTDSAKATTGEEADGDGNADADAASPGGELDLEAAKEFVKITTCAGAPDKPMGVSATVEVTNTLDEPTEYYGTVNFLDAKGTSLTEGVFNTGTLEPGATSTEEIPGVNVYEAVPNVTCELTEVKSDNPA